jgi:IS4 transposase
MLHQAAFSRLIKLHPEAVMVRGVLENVLSNEFVNEVFEQHASKQYSQQLLFSTIVQLLSLVVCRVRPSVHAAYQFMSDLINVTPKSIYNKLNATEPCIAEALVRESSSRMAAIIDELPQSLTPLFSGLKTRIVDGNHLAATEHRLEPLRTIGGAPLPGMALVVYDADRAMVLEAHLREDGHMQEREPLIEVIDSTGPGEVWIADRNFATSAFMWQVDANGSYFIVRRHKQNGRLREVSAWRAAGATETGTIQEMDVMLQDDFGNELPLRLIRIKLYKPTRDGDAALEIFTNMPSKYAAQCLAEAYRCRWRIETAFFNLDRVFEGEIKSLASPRAALFAFALALISYNMLAVLKAALRGVHGEQKIEEELSFYYVGHSVASTWTAVELVALPEDWYAKYGKLTPREMAAELMHLARSVNMAKLKKHRRGEKKPPPARSSTRNQPHVSTHRLLQAAKTKK